MVTIDYLSSNTPTGGRVCHAEVPHLASADSHLDHIDEVGGNVIAEVEWDGRLDIVIHSQRLSFLYNDERNVDKEYTSTGFSAGIDFFRTLENEAGSQISIYNERLPALKRRDPDDLVDSNYP